VRIVFVCAFLGEQGGLENELRATAEVALRAGHEVSICTPHCAADSSVARSLAHRCQFFSAQQSWRETWRGRVLYAGARLKHYLKSGRRPMPAEEHQLARSRMRPAYFDEFWAHQGRQALHEVDLIHMFGKPKRFLLLAAGCARRLQKPVVYEEIAQVSEGYASRPDHQGFMESCNLCDVVIGRSQQHLDDIRRRFGYRGAVEIVEQWAYEDEDRLLALPLSNRTAGGKGIVFGSLARLSGEKGFEMILRAVAKAASGVPGIRFQIAGEGPLREELVRLSQDLGVVQAVEFLGYVPDRVAFYKSIDAFVVASQEEGGPITGAEAMAAGLPIITTPVGAMPERLADGKSGLFVAVDSVSDLSSAVARLAKDADLRGTLGTNARVRYLERNHSRLCASKKIDVWDTLHRGAMRDVMPPLRASLDR
jgi:glycosyltransferase involved in cell wall biosynthesis